MYFHNEATGKWRKSGFPSAANAPDGPRVAIVDDNMASLLAMHMLLSGLGVDHIGCAGGDEIIERCRAGGVETALDVILIAEHMKQRGGIDTVRELRSIGVASPDVKIIGLAATSVDAVRHAWIDAGAADVFAKPFIAEDWRALVARHALCGSGVRGHRAMTRAMHLAVLDDKAPSPPASPPRALPSGGGGGGAALQEYTADILVVDDQRTIIMLLTMMLQRVACKFETCRSGEACVAKHERGERYKVVFMDRAMPGIDGAETVRRVRALGATKANGCAIVGLTGDATPEETVEFTSAGLDALYFKPFTPRVFREIQQRFMGGNEGETPVSCILCSVTFHANHAHNLTRSP